MKTVIFLPTQGPHMPRKGDPEQYDWRVQCRVAAALGKERPDCVIYVPSAFQQAGSPSELAFYGEQLRLEGVPEAGLRLESQGLDTAEQCALAAAMAAREQASLVAVSCHVHVNRVRYLLRKHAVEHVIARGIPSRWLQFTHVVLGVMFPIIDALGLRGHWERYVAKRRMQGKQ